MQGELAGSLDLGQKAKHVCTRVDVCTQTQMASMHCVSHMCVAVCTGGLYVMCGMFAHAHMQVSGVLKCSHKWVVQLCAAHTEFVHLHAHVHMWCAQPWCSDAHALADAACLGTQMRGRDLATQHGGLFCSEKGGQ